MMFIQIWLGFLAIRGSSRELWVEEALQLELFQGYNRDVRPINMGAILKTHDSESSPRISHTRKRKEASETEKSLDEFIQEQCETFIDHLDYYYTHHDDEHDANEAEYGDYEHFLMEEFFGNKTCEAFVASRWKQESGQNMIKAFNINPDFLFLHDWDDFAGPGYSWDADDHWVIVEPIVQLQSINELDIASETIDVTLALYMSWFDPRLTWNPSDFNGIGATTVTKDKVWFPVIDVSNHNNDADNAKEDFYRITLKHTGEMRWLRQMRVKASCSARILYYPYDIQQCGLTFASRENAQNFLHIELQRWNRLNRLTDMDKWTVHHNETMLSVFTNEYFDASHEWHLASYEYEKSIKKNKMTGFDFPTLTVTLSLERLTPYYTLTVTLPVVFVVVIANLGLIIPGDCGEKMGMQITTLLTLVVFLQVLQTSMPVWDHFRNTPKIIEFFSVSIGVVTLSLLITAVSLNMHYMAEDEVWNMGAKVASVAIFIANLLNVLSFNVWLVEPPQTLYDIRNGRKQKPKSSVKSTDKLNHDDVGDAEVLFATEEIVNAWKFCAKVFDRLLFCILNFALFLLFCFSVVRTMFVGQRQ